MEIVNIEKEYKERILKVWNKHKDNVSILNEPGFEYRKSPILPQFIKTNSILFVGINPSFTKGSRIFDNVRKIEFYPPNHSCEKDIAYFEKFKNISEYCDNVDWSHIDLFFMRETKQKILENLAFTNIDFLQDQIDITFEIIERAKPRIIVVANSFASEFFGKKKTKHQTFSKIWKGYHLDFDTDFDKEIGTYKINMGSKEIPIIFSGMLSGQRALDLGSFERLKWQIKKIIESAKPVIG